MKTLDELREDLKEIRYYYARKQAMENGFLSTGKNEVVKKVERYNTAMKIAPIRLYDIYVGLYLNNYTQEAYSMELNYTPEYIQRLNKQLLKFLQGAIKE